MEFVVRELLSIDAINNTSGINFDGNSIVNKELSNGTLSPTAAPKNNKHASSSSSQAASNDNTSNNAARKFGFVALALIIIFAIVILWRIVICYRRKREQQMMALESARADSVLGDMAMVPQHDDDDDGELL